MENKIIKPLLIIINIAIILSLIFSGCSIFGEGEEEASEESLTEEENETIEEEVAESSIITTITLWDCLEPRERMALMESRDQFLSIYRDINLEARHFRSQEELEDQFEAASLAGAGPQLLLLDFDGVYRLAPSNVVKEIVDEVDYAFVLDGLKEISAYNGRDYVIPFRAYNLLTLFYNKDIVENIPRDFEEVFAYIEQVKAQENSEEEVAEKYGFLLNESQADWIIPFVGGYNGWIIDYASNSLTLDSAAMEKTLEFLDYSYSQTGLFEGGLEYGDINELFRAGDAHMIIDYYSTAEEYEEAGIDVGLARIPRVWEGTRYPTPNISGLGFMININTYEEQLDASQEFINFMISQDIQDSWNSSTLTLPAYTDLETSSDPLIVAAMEQAGICRGKPYDQILMVIINAINDNVESLLAGDIVPGDAALKIQEDAIRLRSGIVPLESKQEEGPEEDGNIENGNSDTGQ
jgi:ABC-type glycerol-3-phosphate transport system substrate-binding protein